MLRQKKIEGFQTDSHKDAEIDFVAILAHALEMGLSKTEWEHMRMGEYVDLFEAYKPIHNSKMQKFLYPLPEKQVSMRDL